MYSLKINLISRIELLTYYLDVSESIVILS